jgi:hypothetical protein
MELEEIVVNMRSFIDSVQNRGRPNFKALMNAVSNVQV